MSSKNDTIESTINSLKYAPSRDELVTKLNSLNDGFKTGYKIDSSYGDKEEIIFRPGALTFISAPTKHGKTTALFNFLHNIAESYKDKIHYFFSYEESAHALLPKMFSCYCDLELSGNNYTSLKYWYKNNNSQYIKENHISEVMVKDKLFWEFLKNIRIVYNNYDLNELNKCIDLLGDNEDTGCIFIDYIQLIPINNNSLARHEVIKELCNKLRHIAVNKDLTLVIASQFNRTVQNPETLIVQNLAEGSDIEKSANQIIALWHYGKPATYGKDKKATDNYIKDDKKVLIKILANRDGESDIGSIFKCDYNIKKIYKETSFQYDFSQNEDLTNDSTSKKTTKTVRN